MNCSIVGLDWLLGCIRRRKLLPVTDYLLADISTNMRVHALRSARKKHLTGLKDDKSVVKVPKIAKGLLEELTDDGFPGPGSGKAIPSTLCCVFDPSIFVIHVVLRGFVFFLWKYSDKMVFWVDFAVWKDKEGTWDATFVKLIRPSPVAIYRLQILRNSKTDKYHVVSYRMENGSLIPGTQEELVRLTAAKRTFMRKFEETTGLSWENRLGQPKETKSLFVQCLFMDEETRLLDLKSKLCPEKNAVVELIASADHRKRLLTKMARQIEEDIAAGTVDIHVAGKLELRVGMALLSHLLDHPDLVDGQFSESESVMSLISAYQSLTLTPQSSFTGHRDWVEREADEVLYQRAISLLPQKSQSDDPSWVEAHLGSHIHRALGLRAMTQGN